MIHHRRGSVWIMHQGISDRVTTTTTSNDERPPPSYGPRQRTALARAYRLRGLLAVARLARARAGRAYATDCIYLRRRPMLRACECVSFDSNGPAVVTYRRCERVCVLSRRCIWFNMTPYPTPGPRRTIHHLHRPCSRVTTPTTPRANSKSPPHSGIVCRFWYAARGGRVAIITRRLLVVSSIYRAHSLCAMPHPHRCDWRSCFSKRSSSLCSSSRSKTFSSLR